MNVKRCHLIEALPGHFPLETEENHKKSQHRWSVSQLRFIHITSWIQVKSVTVQTNLFGYSEYVMHHDKKRVKRRKRQQKSCKIWTWNNLETIWNYPTLSEHSKYQNTCAYTHIHTLSHMWTLHTFLYIDMYVCVTYLYIDNTHRSIQCVPGICLTSHETP